MAQYSENFKEIFPDHTPNIQIPDCNPDNLESVQNNGLIDGRRIKFFEKIKTSQVQFVVAGTDNIVGIINASVEGIRIIAN